LAKTAPVCSWRRFDPPVSADRTARSCLVKLLACPGLGRLLPTRLYQFDGATTWRAWTCSLASEMVGPCGCGETSMTDEHQPHLGKRPRQDREVKVNCSRASRSCQTHDLEVGDLCAFRQCARGEHTGCLLKVATRSDALRGEQSRMSMGGRRG
jgi:hypothetical protein